jgi:hypothetical protein
VNLRIAKGLFGITLLAVIIIGAHWSSNTSPKTEKFQKYQHLKHSNKNSSSFSDVLKNVKLKYIPMTFVSHSSKIPIILSERKAATKAAFIAAATATTTTTTPPPTTTTTTQPPAVVTVAQPVAPASGNSQIWNCIIYHESRGNPSAVNSSSGAGGLFQFLPSSWAGYGGLKYASLPEYASVSAQWDVAIAAQAESGWYPWRGDGCTPIG